MLRNKFPIVSPVHRTLVNLTSVIGGEILLRGANFAAVVVIARLYGAATLGLYATALAYATVAVMVAENGMQISSITEIARSVDNANQVISQLCSLRVLLFAALSTILIILGLISGWSTEIWMVGVLVTVRVLLYSYSQLQFSVLKSIDRMPVIGPIQTCTFVLLSVGILATYTLHWTLKSLLWVFIVAQCVEIVLAAGVLWRSSIRPARFLPSSWWHLLKRSTPIGLTYVLAGVTMRADVIVLSTLGTRFDVGHFAAAHMGIVLFYSLSWLFGSVLLPDFTRRLAHAEAFQRYTQNWTKIVILAAGTFALAGAAIAPRVMRLLYGPDFAITGTLAAIMVFAVPFILLNAVYLSRAIALGSARVYLGTYTATAVLAIALDVILAHAYGAIGVAAAIVAREVVMFALFRLQAGVAPRLSAPAPAINAYEAIETIDA